MDRSGSMDLLQDLRQPRVCFCRKSAMLRRPCLFAGDLPIMSWTAESVDSGCLCIEIYARNHFAVRGGLYLSIPSVDTSSY
jgi:hypothetical protein